MTVKVKRRSLDFLSLRREELRVERVFIQRGGDKYSETGVERIGTTG